MSKWSSSTTLKFIREYRNQECLWNTQLENYRDKQTRMIAYLRLVEAMSLPNFGVAEVKNKIKNLRSTFNQEKKKVEKSKNSGGGEDSVYEPSLKWLNELEPTMVNSTTRKRKTFDYVDDDEDWPVGTLSEAGTSDQASSRAASPVNIVVAPETISETIAPPSATPSRKKKIKSLLNAVKDLQAAVNADEDEEDCFDVFGRSVAAQLRKLSGHRAYLAQKDIQNILSDHGIQDIKDGSICK
ncbi:hypothetical protein LSTR_LSTR002462 [Laodelphax striatellus]|uniref:MADF domain-containing protein n=1 Tax=Laodelphax striatellus TaxID=195883 RepID=A0A482X2I2_LAOST|nr:hypothetical protein LSTR_LSTR002462 [Laodelphax striatellus]